LELPIILVVEDDELVQSLLEDTLKEGGFEIAVALPLLTFLMVARRQRRARYAIGCSAETVFHSTSRAIARSSLHALMRHGSEVTPQRCSGQRIVGQATTSLCI
jgi:CheY-like chemotaxis protein